MKRKRRNGLKKSSIKGEEMWALLLVIVTRKRKGSSCRMERSETVKQKSNGKSNKNTPSDVNEEIPTTATVHGKESGGVCIYSVHECGGVGSQPTLFRVNASRSIFFQQRSIDINRRERLMWRAQQKVDPLLPRPFCPSFIRYMENQKPCPDVFPSLNGLRQSSEPQFF